MTTGRGRTRNRDRHNYTYTNTLVDVDISTHVLVNINGSKSTYLFTHDDYDHLTRVVVGLSLSFFIKKIQVVLECISSFVGKSSSEKLNRGLESSEGSPSLNFDTKHLYLYRTVRVFESTLGLQEPRVSHRVDAPLGYGWGDRSFVVRSPAKTCRWKGVSTCESVYPGRGGTSGGARGGGRGLCESGPS